MRDVAAKFDDLPFPAGRSPGAGYHLRMKRRSVPSAKARLQGGGTGKRLAVRVRGMENLLDSGSEKGRNFAQIGGTVFEFVRNMVLPRGL